MERHVDELEQKLQDSHKKLAKKETFEEAVYSIRFLLREFYPSASPSLRNLFYIVISRVATILRTRYTKPGFWNAGLALFWDAEQLVSESSQKKHLQSCISRAQEQLSEIENQPEGSAKNRKTEGYLFEGHLTVDREPPRSRLDDFVPLILEEIPEAPHASKQMVGGPPLTIEEILAKLGPNAECSKCKKKIVEIRDLRELKRHTLPRKPRLDEKATGEERKGAANAIRGGKWMYIA